MLNLYSYLQGHGEIRTFLVNHLEIILQADAH